MELRGMVEDDKTENRYFCNYHQHESSNSISVEKEKNDNVTEKFDNVDDFVSSPQIRSASNKHKPWHWFVLLILWQCLSATLTGTAVFSQLLADRGVNAPTFQSFSNYFLCGFIFSIVLWWRGQWPKLTLWKYFLLALVDVEANFCVVRAFQYTNLTSVQLLDCFTIPSVMFLSRFFFQVRFNARHYIGVVICLGGLGLLVVSDIVAQGSDDSPRNALIGDLYVIFGSLLYAVSNVCQEYVVKTHDFVEYLSVVGIFASVISGVQVAILERNNLTDVTWTWEIGIYFLGFCFCMFALYSIVPVLFVKGSSATVMNLSYLTSDFWSLLFGLYLFNLKLSGLYFMAFGIIILGLLVYNLADSLALVKSYYKRLYDDKESGKMEDVI